MSQPNASLPYFNTYGVKTGDLISPNLGVSKTLSESDGYIREELDIAKADFAAAVVADTTGTAAFTVAKIPAVPGSIRITLDIDGDKKVITDNGSGGLIAEPGVLSAGSVDYAGDDNLVSISFTSPLAAAATAASVVTVIEFVQDQPKELNEMIKGELEYYVAKTAPIIVPLKLIAA